MAGADDGTTAPGCSLIASDRGGNAKIKAHGNASQMPITSSGHRVANLPVQVKTFQRNLRLPQ